MIKSILVPATGADADDAVFSAALAIARGFAAHLAFLHTRVDTADMVIALGGDVGGAFIATDLIAKFEAEAAQREVRAQERVRAFCAYEGVVLNAASLAKPEVTASWHRETGREAEWIAEYGRSFDLVVAGRSEIEDSLATALLETGRPLLIPGPGLDLAGTVALAWKSTREAACAVSSAMPLLARAKRIVILTAVEKAHSDRDSGQRLADNLARHGFAVEMRELVEGSPAAPALLGAAHAASAGLLVMGGYGHSRVREMIFGGVTEHMLRKATMPVWIAH